MEINAGSSDSLLLKIVLDNNDDNADENKSISVAAAKEVDPQIKAVLGHLDSWQFVLLPNSNASS